LQSKVTDLSERKTKKDIPSDELVNKFDNITEMETSSNNVRAIIEQLLFKRGALVCNRRFAGHHKTVFNLYVVDGYGHNKIAEMLNISTGTSNLIFDGKKKSTGSSLSESFSNQQEKNTKARLFHTFFTQNYMIKNLKKDSVIMK
jgi:hypothetical protein